MVGDSGSPWCFFLRWSLAQLNLKTVLAAFKLRCLEEISGLGNDCIVLYYLLGRSNALYSHSSIHTLVEL